MFLYNDPRRKGLRKTLRVRQTTAEARLWLCLSSRRFYGLKFRRQYGIARYVADFYCSELRLVIEVDGDTHSSPDERAYDLEREDFFLALDIQTVRFTNQEVLHDMEYVLERLKTYLPQPPPT